MKANARALLESLGAALASGLREDPPGARHLWVGYSGGMDSHVLLHLLTRLDISPHQLHAVHVDHGLHTDSTRWRAHCERICRQLGVPLKALSVDARPAPGQSPEAAAREARYGAMRSLLNAQAVLLTAHHEDDQAETLLLQLLRGAGPRGLAAMPARARLGEACLLRPMLGLRREQIRRYAEAEGLSWIDDPSNFDTELNRNFLRHEILPKLRQRWPSLGETLSRSARHCAEAADLLQTRAESDLSCVLGELGTPINSSGKNSGENSGTPINSPGPNSDPNSVRLDAGQSGGESSGTPINLSGDSGTGDSGTPMDSGRDSATPINLSRLKGLGDSRAADVLRLWVARAGLPMPHQAHIAQILAQGGAREDAGPLVHWPGAEVRRYRDDLYLMAPLPDIPASGGVSWDPFSILPNPGDFSRQGAESTPVTLDLATAGVLLAQPATGAGLDAAKLRAGRITVDFRRGGERCRPVGRAHGQSLKKLFQEYTVPPWWRERVPLIYLDGVLAAVGDLWLCEPFAAGEGAPGIRVRWLKPGLGSGSRFRREN